MHLRPEGRAEAAEDLARVRDAGGAEVRRPVHLHDVGVVRCLRGQVSADRRQGRSPGDADRHIRVDHGGQDARSRPRDPLQPLDLADPVRHRDDVRAHPEALADLALDAAARILRGVHRDLDEAGLAGESEQPRDRGARGAQLVRDGVHGEVLQVVELRGAQRILRLGVVGAWHGGSFAGRADPGRGDRGIQSARSCNALASNSAPKDAPVQNPATHQGAP